MRLQTSIVAVLLALSYGSVSAGDFVQLSKGNDGTSNLSIANGGIKDGSQNQYADQFNLQIVQSETTYLTDYSDRSSFAYDIPDGGDDNDPRINYGGTGDLVATSISYRTYLGDPANPVNITGAGTLSLVDWRVTKSVDLAAGTGQADIYDFVYRDSTDNKLVFGTRYLNRIDNGEEANYLYRYNFSTTSEYLPQVAWAFLSGYDLRMYEAAMTDDHSFNESVTFAENVVRQKGDFSVKEDNPWSGLFLVKTDAENYELGSKAIGFYQAGEETQQIAGGYISGFVAVSAVPEPENYGLFLAGLGLLNLALRRRKQISGQ